jgi:hypothetical protein
MHHHADLERFAHLLAIGAIATICALALVGALVLWL